MTYYEDSFETDLEREFQRLSDEASESICNYMESIIKNDISLSLEPCLVRYNAYKIDMNGVPINNLFEIAIHGTVQICTFRGDYISDLLCNPTWLDIAKAANDMIIKTKSKNIYLEGIQMVNGKYYFVMDG